MKKATIDGYEFYLEGPLRSEYRANGYWVVGEGAAHHVGTYSEAQRRIDRMREKQQHSWCEAKEASS